MKENKGVLAKKKKTEEKKMTNVFTSTEATKIETIYRLLEENGLSQTQFAQRFEIPLRTVQDWCNGRRCPPPYVIKMIKALLHSKENGGMEK